jgi:predicted acetyltransferase
MGMYEVILTCEINNIASRKIIEKNNGKLLGTFFEKEENEHMYRYSIELTGE